MPLKIRDAKLSDSSALAKLMRELGYATTSPEMRERLRLVVSDARFRTFVGEIESDVCGMIGTFVRPSYEHNDLSGRIVALVTSSTVRRMGIGRALVAAAERDFAQRGIERVAVNTRLSRQDAHKFYEALGYERNGWRFVKQLPVRE
jgi:ribosomal protein S18 acetylase RimI-like enzyme